MDRLTIGDGLPSIVLRTTDGSSLSLPEEIPTRFLMLQFYRGTW